MSINLFKAIIYLPDNFMTMDRIILQNNTPMLSKAMEIYCLGPLVINVILLTADDYFNILRAIYTALLGGKLHYECIEYLFTTFSSKSINSIPITKQRKQRHILITGKRHHRNHCCQSHNTTYPPFVNKGMVFLNNIKHIKMTTDHESHKAYNNAFCKIFVKAIGDLYLLYDQKRAKEV